MPAKIPNLTAAFVALAIALLPLHATASRWALEKDPDLGLSFSYPADVFSRLESDGKPYFHYFASDSAEAKFLVGGWNNLKGQSPAHFKQWLIENIGGYDELTYHPKSRSWFVLSGYRGDSIYYEKVMFSCGGSVVNVMAITYPVNQRDLYDHIVERMENEFKPGKGCGPLGE